MKTQPGDNSQPTDLDQTQDIAKDSGLFGPPPAASQTPSTTKKPGAKPKPRNSTKHNRKSSTKHPAKKQPCDSQGVNSDQNNPKPTNPTAEPDIETISKDFNYSKEQDVYRFMKSALTVKLDSVSNSKLFQVARKIARYIDGLERERDNALDAAHARADKLDPGELLDIVTATLRRNYRKGTLTGSEAKALLSTLQGVAPELFTANNGESDTPDPCALLDHVISWSGWTGEEIVNALGGVEFMEKYLSEALKTPVRLS